MYVATYDVKTACMYVATYDVQTIIIYKYTYVGYYYKHLNITIERHFSSHVYNYVLV